MKTARRESFNEFDAAFSLDYHQRPGRRWVTSRCNGVAYCPPSEHHENAEEREYQQIGKTGCRINAVSRSAYCVQKHHHSEEYEEQGPNHKESYPQRIEQATESVACSLTAVLRLGP